MLNPGLENNSNLMDEYFADPDDDNPLTPIVREAVKLLTLSDELLEVWRKGADQALAQKYSELHSRRASEQEACSTPGSNGK